jgi:hypothetical protein
VKCSRKNLHKRQSIYTRELKILYHQLKKKYCKEHDLKIVAIQIKINKEKIIIFSIYRASSGNFDYFLNKLDYILHSFHRYKLEFIICGNKYKLSANY